MAEKKESKKQEKAKATPGKITKEMNVAEIAINHPATMEVFAKYGMHCIGCIASRFENLEQGCAAHGIDTDAMVKELNAAVEKAKKK